MMSRGFTVLFAALAVATAHSALAQTPPDDLARRVDSIFAEWDSQQSPGCALGVIRDGEFIYRRGYGMANLEHDIPLSSRSVFYIASTSKQFVTASTILAAEQGYLSLNDDVRKWIPELPDYGKTITLRNLFHHTSGLRDYLTLWELAGEEFSDVHEPEEALALIARQKQLNFEPGAEYLYSNSGYLLLALIIERATGKTLRQFAHANIFEPLGMQNSHFHDDHTEISKGRAIGHVRRDDGRIAMYVSNFDLVGSGGLHTSVDELLLWDRNFYENKLGEGTLLEELHRRGVLNSGDTLDYAAGLNVGEYKGLRTVRHGGSAQGYRTDLVRFPDQRFSVTCLCNLGSINPSLLANKVADVYLANEFPLAKGQLQAPLMEQDRIVTLDVAQLETWVGDFRNPETGTIWQVTAGDGRLVVNDLRGFQFNLAPLSAEHFQIVDADFTADVRFQREPRGFHARFNDGDEGTFEAVQLWRPDAAELAVFAGAYYSDELQATWELLLREGELFIIDGPSQPLQPTLENEFRLGGLKLNFERHEDSGRVTSAVIDAGRVRHLRLDRVAEN